MNPVHILESNIPLKESQLWEAQRDFFDKQGIHAWKQVPFFVTSNTFIAERYARLILAYLQDIRTLPSFNPNESVYIVELGTA